MQNNLKHLPAVLCRLKKLRTLLVGSNKELMVPAELINAGTSTLKLFLKVSSVQVFCLCQHFLAYMAEKATEPSDDPTILLVDMKQTIVSL